MFGVGAAPEVGQLKELTVLVGARRRTDALLLSRVPKRSVQGAQRFIGGCEAPWADGLGTDGTAGGLDHAGHGCVQGRAAL